MAASVASAAARSAAAAAASQAAALAAYAPRASPVVASTITLSDADEAELELQAEDLASKALASLPEAAKATKLPIVKASIYNSIPIAINIPCIRIDSRVCMISNI